jgi:hypothetical protein
MFGVLVQSGPGVRRAVRSKMRGYAGSREMAAAIFWVISPKWLVTRRRWILIVRP